VETIKMENTKWSQYKSNMNGGPYATIFDIKRFAINDGPGIRTTDFFKGCPLRCWWCHNPESQSPQVEIMLRPAYCVACLACLEICPHGAIQFVRSANGAVGEILTTRQECRACGACPQVCYSQARQLSGQSFSLAGLMDIIERDVPFFDRSNGGVTFSGGEPLFQAVFLLEILRACRQRGIHTVVDTSGYAPWTAIAPILPFVDLFLYDLKHYDDARHRQTTGVSNCQILENLNRLSEHGNRLIVRIPFVPGINDDRQNLQASAEFLAGLPNLKRVELMAYHHTGLDKYASLGKPYHLEDTSPPSAEQINAAAEIFTSQGLRVKII
jgi:pyruvate formate lyase activating enzyme